MSGTEWLDRLPIGILKVLEKHEVDVLEWFPDLVLICRNCLAIWMPESDPAGKLKRGYWKCPQGCDCSHKK